MRRTITLCACMILCWISIPSHAAEISCADLPKCWGLLSGQISKGDYQKVVTFIEVHHPEHFYLNSPGGDVDEALKIGRLFRKYLLSTWIPGRLPDNANLDEIDNAHWHAVTCASACALIWFGGVHRIGTAGLHRPQISDPMFRGLSPEGASTVYRQVLGRITAYLDEMEVPKPIIESMVATGSSDIRWVDSEGDGLNRPPSIAEWEDASCGKDVTKNWDKGKLTQQQLAEFKKKSRCVSLLLSSHRDHLAPP